MEPQAETAGSLLCDLGVLGEMVVHCETFLRCS